ncbi:response regulator [Haloparvum sp. PAK95]|uniref:response regulator n=1 Tax=Haloparvum sp. PAK95 TaxID=3418962 RepID=UPI003D2EBF83
MGSPGTGSDRVLVVDDQPGLVNLYRVFLEDSRDVRTATSGSEALEAVDETVDVVLLDRRMGAISGDEVLEELRSRENDVPVAMVSAVQPDVDVLELPFDDYIVKPVEEPFLPERVDTLASYDGLDETAREYIRYAAKKAVLDAEYVGDPTKTDAYQTVVARLRDLREQLAEPPSHPYDGVDDDLDPD